MPLGLDRLGDFRHGTPINTATHNFGNPVTIAAPTGHEPQPAPIGTGNIEPQADPTKNSNPVTWSPSPAHFGNPVILP